MRFDRSIRNSAVTLDALLDAADVADHACRPGCGACCIAPSISSPIPGMPDGKPAGVRCVQLGDDLRCAIFGKPERPACCSGLQPQAEMCGASRAEALVWLTRLENETRPSTTTATPAATTRGEQE
jgi:hypothetical protein